VSSQSLGCQYQPLEQQIKFTTIAEITRVFPLC
jgi:hypothetical protein